MLIRSIPSLVLRHHTPASSFSSAAASLDLEALLRSGKKCVCAGKNYAKHVAEMQHTHDGLAPRNTKEPVLFLKPTTSYAFPGEPLVLPASAGEIHHEVELGLLIGTGGKNIAEEDWAAHVAGYVLCLDMTARDLQTAAKKAGLPWSIAKGFDTFLPLSNVVPAAEIHDWRELELRLDVNGERRQTAATCDMVHSVPELVAQISSRMTLEAGDLILTGTPDGVAAVKEGDVMQASMVGSSSSVVGDSPAVICEMRVDVVSEER